MPDTSALKMLFPLFPLSLVPSSPALCYSGPACSCHPQPGETPFEHRTLGRGVLRGGPLCRGDGCRAGRRAAEARLRAGRRRALSAGPMPGGGYQGVCADGFQGLLPVGFRPGHDAYLRHTRPRADAVADGAVPGDLCPQRAQPLHPRREEGRVRRARSLLQVAQPAGAASCSSPTSSGSRRMRAAWTWKTRTSSSASPRRWASTAAWSNWRG